LRIAPYHLCRINGSAFDEVMTMHIRTLPREQIRELIDYLAATYPKAFFTQPLLKRPLKKNILLDLEKDHILDDEKREAALSFYQRDWYYEGALVAGARRIDLNGDEVGTVTEQEQIEARKRIKAGKELHYEKLKALGPVEIVRKLHAAGKVTTDQLRKIPAPPIASPATMTKPEPVSTNGGDLTQLRTLLGNIDSILAKTEDPSLQSALAAAMLKVFIAEATKLIAVLEARQISSVHGAQEV
jgi:ProP effector